MAPWISWLCLLVTVDTDTVGTVDVARVPGTLHFQAWVSYGRSPSHHASFKSDIALCRSNDLDDLGIHHVKNPHKIMRMATIYEHEVAQSSSIWS